MQNAATAENRIHPRTTVRWAARFDDGVRARTGEVRDISERGLFLSWAWRPAKPFAVGDELSVRCAIEDRTVDFTCVVRWMGASRAHACEGIGLEIMNEGGVDGVLAAA
jgi:hypothetical protein